MKALFKPFAIAALGSLSVIPVFGQNETGDTTRLEIGTAKVIIIDSDSSSSDWEDSEPSKSELTFWSGIDLGVNLLMNKENSTDLGEENKWLDLDYSRSLSWRVNIFESKIRLYKDYVGILIGGGLTYNSYGLKNNVDIVSNTTAFPDTIFGVEVADTIRNYTKNKLRATYVHVPLLLEFNTNQDPERTFHIAAGVIGGWKIGSIHKQKYEVENDEIKVRVKEDFNLTPFTLDATARIGYRNFTLFATYGLTPLFEKGKGPEVYPVTIGLSILPFS